MTSEADTRVKRAKRSRMTREDRIAQLLDIAENLFVERGFEATTLEDVARAAGITRPVIYDHFGSKDRLFLACAARARTQFEHDMVASLSTAAGDDTPAEMLRRAGDVFFAMLEQSPTRWALLFGSTMADTGELSDGLDALRRGTIATIAELLTRSAPTLTEEAALACAHSLSGVGEQLGRWWNHHPAVSRTRVLTYYSNFIAGGLERVAALNIATTTSINDDPASQEGATA